MNSDFNNDRFPQWQEFPWPDFRDSSERQPVLAVQPVCALQERANDLPFDLEEKWIFACLNQAAQETDPVCVERIRTLPCFRNVPTLRPRQVFGTTVREGSRALYEIASSVANSSVRKIAFIHCNRALGDWIDTLARKLRIEANIQAFNINLEGMGVPPEDKLTLPTAETIRSTTPGLVAALEEILAFPTISAFSPHIADDQ